MDELSTIRSEFRKFGETVSVRGVPRIFKSQAIFVKSCWLIAVLASSGLLIWQLSAVFAKYTSYPVSTSFEEGRDWPVFPDVTVCNLNPEAVNKEYENYTLSDYKRKVHSIIENNVTMADLLSNSWIFGDYNWTGNDVLQYVRSDAFPSTTYLLNFPMNVDNKNSSNQNLIVDNYYYGWKWDEVYRSFGNIEPISSAEYYRCYTLRVLDKERAKRIRTMNVILYINDSVNYVGKDDYYTPDIYASGATGVRLVVHPPGTIPILSSGISIGPGTETTIKVDSTQRTRLHYPYSKSDCTDQTFLPYSNGDLYGYENCQSVCLQQQVVDSCHCLSSSYKYTDQQVQQTNSTICGNVSWIGEVNLLKALKDLQCISNVKIEFDKCDRMCLFPCKETYYEYSGSTAPWPHISLHIAFYNNYIRNKSLDVNEFRAYRVISTLENYTEIVDRLKNLHLIQDNFLVVNVVMNSRYVYLLTDKAQMTWEVMLSSIGGCLSLWLGVTVMTFVEVVEFLFTLGSICYQNRKSKNRVMDFNCDDVVTGDNIHLQTQKC